MIDRLTTAGMTPRAIGAAGMPALTFIDDRPSAHESPQAEMGEGPAASGNPQFFLVGFVLLLAILWLARKQSDALQREVLGVNLFNLLVIGTTAVLFISLGKVLTARFPVPGLTPVFASL
jgi:hypothetical protein